MRQASVEEKRQAVKEATIAKYREAIDLYTTTSLSIKEICEQTGVSFSAFCSYLSKHHRELILQRHNLTHHPKARLRGTKGQTTEGHHKYRDAITACDSQEYIEYNISQIARIFGVNCSSLANQLRRHYPEIIPRRELARQRMGITINLQYGARQWSKQGYAEAVEMLQSTDMTIEEAARACNVSHTGLREHISAYHPQIAAYRESRRTAAVGQQVRGKRNGCWGVHQPTEDTEKKYEKAVELYRTTSLPVAEIARSAGVSKGGFHSYLRSWYPELMVERRGYDSGIALKHTKRYRKDTTEKYAPAIERLAHSTLSVAEVAAEAGLNAHTFRYYLKEHHPQLLESDGMAQMPDGRRVSKRSMAKYAEAVHLYGTTPEPLHSIATRLGLNPKSLSGFIHRNHPELVERRKSGSSSTKQEAS